jgi:hypothetical protein
MPTSEYPEGNPVMGMVVVVPGVEESNLSN